MGRCVRVWLEAARVGAKSGKNDKETVSSVCDGNKRKINPYSVSICGPSSQQ